MLSLLANLLLAARLAARGARFLSIRNEYVLLTGLVVLVFALLSLLLQLVLVLKNTIEIVRSMCCVTLARFALWLA